MFRVLERATGLLAIAPLEQTTRARRSAPAANGRVAILIDPLPAAPMPAPWGEPAEPFPWVVVSTRLWTDVYPGMDRRGVIAADIPRVRPAGRPIDIVRRPATPLTPASEPTYTRPTLVGAHDPTPTPAERKRRAARPRRGFVARLVLLAIGLLVSLVAVEAAARVNRR